MKKSTMVVVLLMFALMVGASAAQEIGDDANNVLIVLDASGSMDDMMQGTSLQKMAAAKNALIRVLEQIPENTNVGLLVFSSSNLRNDWVYPLGSLDKVKLEEAIRLPMPQGRTPLGAYIKKGADRLLKQRESQFGYGTYRLLIVTDGEAQDQDLVNQFVPEVIARGITMDVIGVDMRKEHTLATRVHSYRRADNPESLARALIEVFAEVGGTGNDAAGENAFDEIAAIPEETAKAMLKAISSSGNQPIGETRTDLDEQSPSRETNKK
ncbi:MAG: VWA domain-containing protein [Desulfosalsimonadaceae bacterium]|nr:VWA domain-containing protein [Desulfosalsimonadaceae bacterium]